MSAAAPEGAPPQRIRNYRTPKMSPAPPCLGEALMRGGLDLFFVCSCMGGSPKEHTLKKSGNLINLF